MLYQRQLNLVPLMISATDSLVTPVRMTWPICRAIAELGHHDAQEIADYFGELEVEAVECAGAHYPVLAASLRLAVSARLVRCEGEGILARWVVDEVEAALWRRRLLVLRPELVLALRHAGKRWAILAETVLKNLDTAAASWVSKSVGEMSEPRERQAPLVAL